MLVYLMQMRPFEPAVRRRPGRVADGAAPAQHRSQVEEGGQWNMVADLVEKLSLVAPSDAQ